MTISTMYVSDSLKEKVIIVAEPDELSCHRIVSILEGQGYLDIRYVYSGEKIFEILRFFYERPERIGLIVLNEKLLDKQLAEACQSLSTIADTSAIPFLIFSGHPSETFTKDSASALTDSWLVHKLNTPVVAHELLLAVTLLLKLKHERFLRLKQEERLVDQLAIKNSNDANLKYLIAHDELTGLFNRNNFERQLKLALNLCSKLRKEGALLFIDVDRFCLINELEGFDVGDRLLVELTVLMRKHAPRKSLFARVGGDEFCLFVENMSRVQAQQCAETIKMAVENYRFYSEEVCHSATVSIGITTTDSGISVNHPGEMIMRARQACNFAKLGGRDKIGIYDNENVNIKERRRDIYWVPIIRKALRQNDLFLVFQPVVQLDNGNISHYEVLLRMRGDDGKTISPHIFVPVAERMGLIHAIDLWVVENAIDFLAGLPGHKSYVSIAINLSGTMFQYPDLLEVIREKLKLSWVDPSRLTFEITETSAVDNFDRTREMIDKIRAIGCKFALDDFGAGFCSFNYLKLFPVDYVKIDGQFVRNLINNETDQILVKSMVDTAEKLGKKTIAEFVESPDTLLKLRELGVNLGQGYAFGKPERDLLEGSSVCLEALFDDKDNPSNVLDGCLS
ncbi:MAG: putative bifunctional diguanylate cyclase/phosphodiesterase [Methylomonas sp.]